MLRSAVLLLMGNATGFLMLLVRNILVARLISIEDYGVASTFAIVMAFLEASSQSGLQQLIIQRTDGDDPALQTSLQGLHLLRGMIASVLLFLIAHPLAQFLGIGQVAWAYQAMALIPLFKGLAHYDMYRFQRKMRFLPSILTFSCSNVISVTVVWAFAYIYSDYRIMLYAVLIQAFAEVIITHLLAERSYRVALNRIIVADALKFGWPLLANAMLLFVVMQGEKLVVGHESSIFALALFAMGFTLTLTPTLVLSRSIISFFLPRLSAVKDDPGRFRYLSVAAIQVNIANGLLVILGVAAFGPIFIHLALGAKYEALVPLLNWFAILHGVRVFKTGGTIAAIARGRTEIAMIGNFGRLASLPVSWWAATHGASIQEILWIATTGELLGCAVTFYLIDRRVGVNFKSMLPTIAVTSLFTLVSIALSIVQETWGEASLNPAVHTAVLIVAAAPCAFVMKELRRAAWIEDQPKRIAVH